MSSSPRLIRSRIKSVTGTKKITKAIEMVSAAKMRRSTSATIASRPYATAGGELIVRLAATGVHPHPLLATRELKRTLLVVISSHRGLAGGFNANIIKKAVEAYGPNTDVVTVGRKGEDALRRLGKPIVASFPILRDVPTALDARPLAAFVIDQFSKAIYDKVLIAYTDFVSAVVQKAQVRTLLPLSVGSAKTAPTEYLFEPTPAAILDFVLPRMVETQIYQTLLESSASEHSARMMAMRNATDAATDMVDDLTFTLNQARQAGITREISEIAAGKAALE